jgi:RNA polymerase sigma-70 factor (ECF subfamily)
MAVARFFLQTGNVFRSSLPEDAHAELAEVNRQPALVIRSGERAFSVMTIEVEDGHIQTIRVVVNPDKLAHV